MIEPSQPAEMADMDSEGDSDMVREPRETVYVAIVSCIFCGSGDRLLSYHHRVIQRMVIPAQTSKEI